MVRELLWKIVLFFRPVRFIVNGFESSLYKPGGAKNKSVIRIPALHRIDK